MLSVTAIGMVSPLGLDCVTSCAGARASIQRTVESDDLFLPDPDNEGVEALKVSLRRVPVVSAGFFGLGRRAQLGTAALADLERSAGRLDDCRAGFVLVVGNDIYRTAWARQMRKDPELADEVDLDYYEGALRVLHERYVGELLGLLIRRSGFAIAPEACRTVCSTAVGLDQALRQAEDWLTRGACDRCVIGAIDSLIDPITLEALGKLRLLKTANQPVGFAPAEAAAFIVVELPEDAKARQAEIKAVIDAYTTANGPPHPSLDDASESKDGLSVAVAQALAVPGQPARVPGLAVVNLNGDPYRAQSWGYAIARPQPPGLRSAPVWTPALAFGETGAAAGLVSVALLSQAWTRGYAPSANALVCLIDDLGGRMAALVSAPS
jgi:3-oxoacyl-(acyl-carrier-protein) synthase